VTQDRGTAQDYCYRHPNRQSFVLCQRCGRTICGECQTPAPVGFVCPECMREQRASAPRTRPAILTRMTGANAPVVTYGIIAICVLVFIAQSLPGIGGTVTAALQYAGLYSYPQLFQPWRLFTSIFAHANFFHILLNMYTLWVFGMVMEPMLGRVRYLVVFLISGFAGSVGVLFLAAPNQPVVGASGAIFGLMGALIIIQRKLGGPMMQLLILVGINLVIGFIPAFGIAWQAHVGGLVGGALAGVILTETRSRARRPLQIGLLVLLSVVLVVVSLWHFYV
jgi:membrane associated rhomboid family serine protease